MGAGKKKHGTDNRRRELCERKGRGYQIFSSTDHPISPETKLWRYLTFEKFAWLLEKSKLYHTRLDQLGDPFEGSVTKAYAQKRDAGQLRPRFSRREFEPLIFKRLLFCSFVTCWHASPHESAAMWKLYSTERAGVAIVSSPVRMEEAVELSPYHTGMLAPVEYLDFEKQDGSLPFGKQARPGFLKRKSFEHEKEVRGMILFEKDPTGDLSADGVERLRDCQPLGIELKVELKRLIEKIYVSPLATSYFKDLVATLTDRHGLAGLVHPSTLLGKPVY